MSLLDSIILGMVQGLSEFLPISSSGHLVLFQKFLGLEEPGVTLEVLLHFGTLLSIIWVFRSEFMELSKFNRDPLQKRFLFLLVIGTVTTAVIAILLQPVALTAFKSTLFVGVMLLVTGGILWTITLLPLRNKKLDTMSPLDAIWIGAFQGLAIFPGISRSGSTIMSSLWRKLDRATAVRYSFILATPAILGATLVEARELYMEGLSGTIMLNYFVGAAVAFTFGVLAIRIFVNLLQNKRFHYFAYYCWTVGSITIYLSIR